ncbi:hypothetical protein ACMV8I_02560 [Ewingella sp. S1.OA.A_B6]
MTDKTDIAAQLSKRILHYADMASCTSEGTSVLGADLLKLIGDTINDLSGKLEAERQRADKAELALIKPLPIGELIQRLEGQTYEKWFSQSELRVDQVPVGEIVTWSGTNREKGITRDVDFRFLRFDVQPGQQLFTAAQAQKPVAFPDINEDLVEILGRPNFTCSGIAEIFRGNGADIKRKSENEQAFIIHWLIGVYLTHGSDWRLVAEASLQISKGCWLHRVG